jgi:hypothetical protein
MADDSENLRAHAAALYAQLVAEAAPKPVLRDDLGREVRQGLSAREAARMINLICDLALTAHRLGTRACDEALADIELQRAALLRARRGR